MGEETTMELREDSSCTVQQALLEEGRMQEKKEAVSDTGDEPETDNLPSSFVSFVSILLQVSDHIDLPASVSFLRKQLRVEGLQASVSFLQQLLAEFLATFLLIFAGCGAITRRVSDINVAVVWGSVVVAMVCLVGHVSGAHMNPAVTLGFAVAGRFRWRKVPAYMAVQTAAATAASLMVRLIFPTSHWDWRRYGPATLPWGSNLQSLMLEFIITFYLMFVIMAVATDYRAVGPKAGVAVGGTIVFNMLLASSVSRASMNPARSMGPAFVWPSHGFRSLWVYLVGPFAGAACGAQAHRLLFADIRRTNMTKDLGEVTKSTNPTI